MRRLLFLFAFLNISLFGYEYDELTLKAQSAIFPKLLLLDQDISQKLINQEIVFSIVCEDDDKRSAIKIKNLIEKQFRGKIGKYRLKVIIQSFEDVENQKPTATAYYILNTEYMKMQKVSYVGMDNNLILFSYDKNYFQNGVLISLAIKGTTVIYLNKEILKSYNINFVDAFYQIVKFEDGR
jgi:hypothetical protein